MRAAAIRAEQRERRARTKIRREAVERLKLPFCRVCGGTTDTTQREDLLCDCAAKRHALEARLHGIVEQHDQPRDLGSVLAP